MQAQLSSVWCFSHLKVPFLRELRCSAQPFPVVTCIYSVFLCRQADTFSLSSLQIWPDDRIQGKMSLLLKQSPPAICVYTFFILAQSGLEFNPKVQFQRSSWSPSWKKTKVGRGWEVNSAVGAIMWGLAGMLKQLLSLLFRFMRTLAVTEGPVLWWQEFSSLSVGPGDARLAVITFQIGIWVHERRRCRHWERLHATWMGVKKTGWCTVVMESSSSSLKLNAN